MDTHKKSQAKWLGNLPGFSATGHYALIYSAYARFYISILSWISRKSSGKDGNAWHFYVKHVERGVKDE